jgi:hypothetical protein
VRELSQKVALFKDREVAAKASLEFSEQANQGLRAELENARVAHKSLEAQITEAMNSVAESRLQLSLLTQELEGLRLQEGIENLEIVLQSVAKQQKSWAHDFHFRHNQMQEGIENLEIVLESVAKEQNRWVHDLHCKLSVVEDNMMQALAKAKAQRLWMFQAPTFDKSQVQKCEILFVASQIASNLTDIVNEYGKILGCLNVQTPFTAQVPVFAKKVLLTGLTKAGSEYTSLVGIYSLCDRHSNGLPVYYKDTHDNRALWYDRY